MQSPAGPESHPHTRPRPAHWLATAAALGGVITGVALLGPGDATATAPATGPETAAAAPDARAARYPVDCGRASAEVVREATGDLDGDGRAETTAVVRCPSGAGTPPSGVYVLAPPAAPGAPPRIVATLVDPGQKMSVTGLGITERTVSATLAGYSAASVPRCCPDLRRTVKWHWREGKFVLTPLPVAARA
ncbi:hypothetical protein [Streptomyces griseocarneus]|uniref:hypothetical protein n=1 Tax=Streptomyces griseocarneus TaxID=51201 RepID=UPI00167DCDBD|nr:hypothetical protein [Streptomyces griseocarneus]MBZ6474575.1 hypothetical protein [Streptomyces griseocarneus]